LVPSITNKNFWHSKWAKFERHIKTKVETLKNVGSVFPKNGTNRTFALMRGNSLNDESV